MAQAFIAYRQRAPCLLEDARLVLTKQDLVVVKQGTPPVVRRNPARAAVAAPAAVAEKRPYTVESFNTRKTFRATVEARDSTLKLIPEDPRFKRKRIKVLALAYALFFIVLRALRAKYIIPKSALRFFT